MKSLALKGAALLLILPALCAYAASDIPALGKNPAAAPPSPTDAVDRAAGFSRGFLNSIKEEVANLKSAKRLPVRGLVMIETKDGKTYLLSEDGRLAIMGGKWVDLWEKKQITSVEDAASLDRINFAKLGIDPDEITSLRIGSGGRRVTLFADPTDPLTKALAAQIRPLMASFSFNIVLVPRKAGEANKVIAQLVCASDKASVQNAFLSGTFTGLPAPHNACDYKTVAKGMSTALALRIPGLPLVIRDDGATAYGPSISLASALGVQAR